MFIDGLQSEMRAELGALNDAMPLDWLGIWPRPGNQGGVKLSPLDALPEPNNLCRLKKVIVGRGHGGADRRIQEGRAALGLPDHDLLDVLPR